LTNGLLVAVAVADDDIDKNLFQYNSKPIFHVEPDSLQ
jgi:hypothetical protein